MYLRPRALLAALLGSVLLAPASASAAASPFWLSTPSVLTDGTHDASDMDGIFDADGNAVVFFVADDGSNNHFMIQTRAPGSDTWAPAVDVSGPGANNDFGAGAATPNGRVTVLWRQNFSGGGHPVVMSANRTGASGEWTVTQVSDTPGASASNPTVVSAPNGVVTAAWDADGDIYTANQRPDGTWSDQTMISAGDQGSKPRIHASATGELTVLWGGNSGGVYSATRPADGTWGAPVTLQGGGSPPDLVSMTTDTAGNAVATWHICPSGMCTVYLARRAAGEASWNVVEAGDSGVFSALPSVAALPSGAILAVWTTAPGGNYQSAQRIWDAGADHWGAAQTIATPEGIYGAPRIVASASGEIFGTVINLVDGEQVMTAVRFDAATGTFTQPRALPGSDMALYTYPNLAADDDGNMLVSWMEADAGAGHYRVHAAIVDGGGPTLSDLTVPTTAVAGQPVALSAAASDRWSGLGGVSWSFGDGRSGSGSATSHTFDAPGTYTVSAQVFDDLGNVTASEDRTITVSAASAPSEPDSAAPAPTPAPATPLAPVLEARLAGRTVTINARMTLKAGKACSGNATATTAFGQTRYRATLQLKRSGKACLATGTIKLKKAPSMRTKLKLAITGKSVRSRALTTKRS